MSVNKWQTSNSTKLFVFVLFFSLCALLIQHHLAMMSVLNRHLASVWTSKYSQELKIILQKQNNHNQIDPKASTDKLKQTAAFKKLGNTVLNLKGSVEIGISRDQNPPVFTNETWEQMDDYQIILLKLIAFIDRRVDDKPPILRMLVYKNHNLLHTGACIVQNSSTLTWTEISGKFTLINLPSPKCKGGCEWRYEAYYFDCQLRVATPSAVKFRLIPGRPNTTAEISQPIRTIRTAKPVETPEHEVAVCAKALYKYNVWLRLMLFIEVYHHLDINAPPKYFYKFESLSKYGQILAHNHCLLSLMGRARHVILVDIDEFILPTAWNDRDTLKNSIPRLLDAKSKQGGKIGGFQVRSAFANVSFPEFQNITTVSVENLKLPLVFQPFTHFDIQKPGQRCKMIMKPEATDKMTVHRPFQYLNKFREDVLRPDEALIYHLRNKGSFVNYVRF